VQTKSDSVANINARGSNVVVQPDSLVKYDAGAVELEHGSLKVATSKNLAARIGDVTVTPAAGDWTEFRVADVDGAVKIVATKGDLTIQDQSGTTTLPAGQETTREETRKRKRREGGAVAAAHGGILDSKAAIITGTIAVGGVTTWVLSQGDDPASPDKP